MTQNKTPMVSFTNKSTEKAVNLFEADEIRDFVGLQIKGYEWVSKLNNTNLVHDLRQNVFQPLYQSSTILQSPVLDNQSASNINHYLNSTFGQSGLPTVDTPDYAFVEEVRQKHSDHAAIIALAYILNRLEHLSVAHRTSWVGLLLAVLREEGLGNSAAKSAKKNYDDLNAKLKSQIALAANEEKARSEEHSLALQALKRRSDILRRWQWRVAERANARAKLESDIAISDLDNVRKTYEEMMKLKAPVDYWRDKAKEHRIESKRYRDTLLWHAWWVAPGVITSLLCVAYISFAFAQADKPFSAYLILVTIGVVITTMAFWATRILVRFYMSEHHLAIDAEERATMAMTYLALIERGAADEKERALILAPLFRPSSDGIVKDDAAPDLSPAVLLSKLINK